MKTKCIILSNVKFNPQTNELVLMCKELSVSKEIAFLRNKLFNYLLLNRHKWHENKVCLKLEFNMNKKI